MVVTGTVWWGREKKKVLFKRYRVSVWGDRKVMEMNGGDSCPRM